MHAFKSSYRASLAILAILSLAVPGPTVSAQSVSIADTLTSEGVTESILVTAPTPSGQPPFTVDYATRDGTAVAGKDYVATSGTLTINPTVPYAYIYVPISEDSTFETHETFFITLSSAGASILDGEAEVTIVNNDPVPVVSVVGTTVTEPDFLPVRPRQQPSSASPIRPAG
jgi:Calx-beta domain